VDKASGYLRVDRPQRTSSQPPSLYGFIPRTYCGAKVTRAEIIVPARVVGGLQLVDRGEADDKLIAVVEGDFVWGNATDVASLPPIMIERLQHYFQTYKLVPGAKQPITVQRVYGVDHAVRVVEASIADYQGLLAGR
jgi:inorganic pyrophosphatase